MAAPKITFYFDIGSPFSCIAFHILKSSRVFAKCEIDYVPVSLRDLFQTCQNTPPVAVKNKFQWINRERIYWARRFGVPMSKALPGGFPASTAHVQQALGLVARYYPEELVAIVQRVYGEFWQEGNSRILTPDGFSTIFEEQLGSDNAKRILQEGQTSEAKTVLDENTQKAFGSGAFGLPWLSCTQTEGETESFWGIDHFGRLVDFLKLDRSLDKSFEVLL